MDWQSWMFGLFWLLGTVSTHKILVFSPTISRSHVISNSRIADALAGAGHNVTLLEIVWIIPASTSSPVKKAHHRVVDGFGSQQLYTASNAHLTLSVFNDQRGWRHVFTTINQYRTFNVINNKACGLFLDANQELFRQLREEHYDIYFGEQLTLCGSGLSHHLGIPIHFWISSTTLLEYMTWMLAVPTPVSYLPNVLEAENSGDKLGYWERARALFAYVGLLNVYLQGAHGLTQVFRQRYGEDFPDVADIVRDSPLVFVNTHELVDFPGPTLHNVIHIGGLGVQSPANASNAGQTFLSEPFASEVRKGRIGLVYFSLGTVVSTELLPTEFVYNLLEAFSLLDDFHFIMKVDAGDKRLEERVRSAHYTNIHLASWVPQPELFAIGRVKAFITHGGYNSLMEAAKNGIPLVGMGFFADQYRNALLAERNGWGIAFDQRDLLEGSSKFLNTLRELLYNEKYQQCAKRIQRLLANCPTTPEERLVKYVEFVATSGEGRLPELQVEGRRLSFMVYHNLDIILPFALLLIITLYLTLRISLSALKWVFSGCLQVWGGKKNKTE